MTGSVICGLVMWTLFIWATVRLMRYNKKVSGNKATKTKTGTGPKWEQDKPFPECFDEMEDDL